MGHIESTDCFMIASQRPPPPISSLAYHPQAFKSTLSPPTIRRCFAANRDITLWRKLLQQKGWHSTKWLLRFGIAFLLAEDNIQNYMYFELFVFFVAGYETTANTVTSGLYFLAKKSRIYRQTSSGSWRVWSESKLFWAFQQLVMLQLFRTWTV